VGGETPTALPAGGGIAAVLAGGSMLLPACEGTGSALG